MSRRTDPFRLRAGFVLPVVLGLILLAGLIAVHAATDLGTQTTLATTRLLHQRAFEAAESGVAAALHQLEAGQIPPPSRLLNSAVMPSDQALVEYSNRFTNTLPPGQSVGRVVESHDEIRSEGRSARNSRVVIVQGIRRLSVVAP